MLLDITGFAVMAFAVFLAVVIVCFVIYFTIRTKTIKVHITGVEVELPKGTKEIAIQNTTVTAKAISNVSNTYYTNDAIMSIRTIQDWFDKHQKISYFMILDTEVTLDVGGVELEALNDQVKIILSRTGNIMKIYIVPEKRDAGKLRVKSLRHIKLKYQPSRTSVAAGYIEFEGPAVMPTFKQSLPKSCYGRGVPKI